MKCVCIFDVHVFYRRDVCRSESKKKIFTKFCPEMDSCLKKKNSHISLFFMCQSYEPNYCNFCKQSEILSFQKVNDYFVLGVINNVSGL